MFFVSISSTAFAATNHYPGNFASKGMDVSGDTCEEVALTCWPFSTTSLPTALVANPLNEEQKSDLVQEAERVLNGGTSDIFVDPMDARDCLDSVGM